jgi:hypothetical protein
MHHLIGHFSIVPVLLLILGVVLIIRAVDRS